ncbi:hypothetical protein NMY22_g18926 [Coprinellus aureogranulatus]|nr:hypothetical protein NMY22_g18926 [Coprinellus aureogranulatus]
MFMPRIWSPFDFKDSSTAKISLWSNSYPHSSLNSSELGLESVGELFQIDQELRFTVTPQYASRNPRTSMPHWRLCGIDLLFSWKAEDDTQAPFATQCPLPYLSLLNNVVHRFVTFQLARRYPLIFGSWCKQLSIEAPFVKSIEKSVKDIMLSTHSVLHEFVDPIVASAIQKKRVGGEKEDDTLLQNLVNSTEDPIILRDEVMNLLVAGRDTTASLLTFTVYMLSEHPAVLSRLRAEIMSQVGPSGRPTLEDFREMKYLRAVLNETLRLYPPVPFNMRRSKDETVLPPLRPTDKPLYIAPDTRLSYSVISMHRRTDLWGPDALEFDPDRFLDDRLQKICLGQQFAYHEASFFLVRLLQAFSSISLAPEAQPVDSRPPAEWASSPDLRIRREKVKPKTHLTLYVQGGLWTRMGDSSDKGV